MIRAARSKISEIFDRMGLASRMIFYMIYLVLIICAAAPYRLGAKNKNLLESIGLVFFDHV